jgi:hypothetical protein
MTDAWEARYYKLEDDLAEWDAIANKLSEVIREIRYIVNRPSASEHWKLKEISAAVERVNV